MGLGRNVPIQPQLKCQKHRYTLIEQSIDACHSNRTVSARPAIINLAMPLLTFQAIKNYNRAYVVTGGH